MSDDGDIRVVDTAGFWKAMRHPAFIRLNLRQGKIGPVLYFTDAPPETVPGFLVNVVESAVRDLNINTPFGLRWPWQTKNHHPA